MSERDKFLTEAMGECWLEKSFFIEGEENCPKCLKGHENINFFTWEGFGNLWEWAQKQKWWEQYCFLHDPLTTCGCWELLVQPDRFANSVYEFLKEQP